MFKAKHWGVAVAIMLTAVGAMANNFRAADQVYVAAAAHAAGGSGTFISDVFISNMSSDSVDVTFIYGPQGLATPTTLFTSTQQNPSWKLTLLPMERREIVDFFPTVLGLQTAFGQLVFNACKSGSTCTPDSNGDSLDFRNITVETRIYQIPPGRLLTDNPPPPTTGQLFSGIPWYNFASNNSSGAGLNTVFITGFRQTANYRANFGLVNASQYSTTFITATLFDGKTGNAIGSFSTDLGPLGMIQKNIAQTAEFAAFTAAPFNGTNAYMVVTQSNIRPTADAAANGCTDGCPAFLAYGSVLDNNSGDATTLEAQFTKSLTQVQIQAIYNPDTVNCSLKSGTPRLHRAVKH